MKVLNLVCLVLLVTVAAGLPQFGGKNRNNNNNQDEDEEPKDGTHPATQEEQDSSAEHQHREQDEQRVKEQVVQVCSNGDNATCSCPNSRSPPCLPFQKANCTCEDGSTPSAHLVLPPLPVAPAVAAPLSAAVAHPTCSNGQLARCGIFCANGATPPCVIGNEPTCTCLDGSTPERHNSQSSAAEEVPEEKKKKEDHDGKVDEEEEASGNKTHSQSVNKPIRPFGGSSNNSSGFNPGQHTKPFADKEEGGAHGEEEEEKPHKRPFDQDKKGESDEVESNDEERSSTARSAVRIPTPFARLPQREGETEEQKLAKRRQPQPSAEEEQQSNNNNRNNSFDN
jgi:hypothetical protein